MKPIRITVPANLLLAGEYAVLEDGGIGLGVSVDKRVGVTLTSGSGISFRGSWLGTTREAFRFPEDDVTSLPYLVLTYLASHKGVNPVKDTAFEVDSTPLFYPDGAKRGYGSSAAVTAGITAAWLYAGSGSIPSAEDVFPLAVNAHRFAQGGRGSGYDVACSTFGSAGKFTGGNHPQWQPLATDWIPSSYLFPGPERVSTADAIKSYEIWKEMDPGEARVFLNESNDAVSVLSECRSVDDVFGRLPICTRMGIELGEAIGIPAVIDPPIGWTGGVYKAVGAGNELGIFLTSEPLPDGMVGPDCDAITISREGLVWES